MCPRACSACRLPTTLGPTAPTKAPTFSPLRADSLREEQKGQFENPQVTATAKQQLDVETEGTDHDIQQMSCSQQADVDMRDHTEKKDTGLSEDTTSENLGEIGSQKTGAHAY